jgi:hypothetical protein
MPEVSEQENCQIRVGYHTNIWGDIVVGNKDVDIRLTDVPFDLAAMMLVPLGEYLRQHKKEQSEDAD